MTRTPAPSTAVSQRLIAQLPEVRGRYVENAPLSKETWFRVGGAADVLFRPADRDDLVTFLRGCPTGIPLLVLGVGSNMLVRDGGVRGVVIRMGREMGTVTVRETQVEAGAGAADPAVAAAARDADLGGLEFLSGIPGTIGGALRMNAGAYGREMQDVVVEAEAISPDGTLHTLSHDDMGFSYRHCAVDEQWVFTRATLQATPDQRPDIAARMAAIREAREDSQPLRTRTGGSTFRNPSGHSAWKLVDDAGCRGLRIGGAMVSPKHTNFLINTGTATAAEIEALGEEVRRRVKDQSGIELQWEIRRVGEPGAKAAPAAVATPVAGGTA